ncbi:MAG: hypothetical protein ABIQ64_02045 [Candidatus Saccharimonadales bacterium]
MNTFDAYPEVRRLECLDTLEPVVARHMSTPIATWAEQLTNGLDTFSVGEQDFRAYTDIPSDSTDSVVLMTGEHGNSYWAQHNKRMPNPAVVRAHIIRDAIDPNATLAYFSGDALGEPNLHLSPDELKELNKGFLTPISDRIEALIAALPNHSELNRGTGIGMSLGATVLSNLMVFGNTPLNSAVYIEAPNVVERHKRELMKSFMTSGNELAANIALNHDIATSEVAAEHAKSVDIKSVRGVLGMGIFGVGLLALPTNRALLRPMLTHSLSRQLAVSIKNGHNVVHAWGTKANVSPVSGNRAIRDRFNDDPLYDSFEFFGQHADHSLTNVYSVMGALARHAAR